MFFKHFASKNQLPGSSVSGTLVENGLNKRQQYLFNYVIQWAAKYYFDETNDASEPDPFYTFLTGGVGVGKSFSLNLLTKYLNRLLRYRGQNICEQSSACVTASTGKTASNISGFTIHSALNFPTDKFQSFANQPPKLGHSTLATL